jgi:hypothetical protein
MSCWTSSAQMRLTSCFVCTSHRAHSKAINPSSHAVMAPSQLSSSLSWVRSCPYSSTATTFERDRALHQSTSRDRCHDRKQALAKRCHRVKLHLTNQQAEIGVTTERSIYPCSVGRRLVAIMVVAPAPRTLVVVSLTSHHRQWSGPGFKIDGEER